jgi:pyrimidine-nucleoside phosphorylase
MSLPVGFSVVEVLEKKKKGQELLDEEIKIFVDGFATGAIPDYQAAAFLMAVCLKGMTPHETAVLTKAMKESGTIADLSDIAAPKVDKHSTGGVGDKTSLILAPIVASLGAAVPMMSGRGLGHTGGTLDKLEAIPGFRVAMSADEFKDVLRSVGVAIIGTTADMAPADKKMYALRDVTCTVASLPLITGSIMCKKLAENPDSLVLDVKTGVGAFMAKEEDAIELAQSMIAAGEGDGKVTTAFVTAMDQPLGRAIGNWLEVAESIRTLSGSGPEDLTDLSVTLAAQMLVQAKPEGHSGGGGGGGKAKKAKTAGGDAFATLASATERARAQLHNGEALARFRAMVEAQGGDPSVVDAFSNSPHGPEATGPLSSGAAKLEIYQVVYGSGDAAPANLSALAGASGAKPHGCFWGPPCQGLDGCRSLDAFFRRAYGTDACPADEAPKAGESDLAHSLRAPHGPPVGVVASLNALEIGRACIGIGAGRQVMGEALSLGSGVLLHKKVGDPLRQGDVLLTLFAEVGGSEGPSGTRRVIDQSAVDAACARILEAYGFSKGAADAHKPSQLIRCFIDRDGSVKRL